MTKTIDQKLRTWCAEMRGQGYTEEDIFHALAAELKRLDSLAEISEHRDPSTPSTS